ncbi:MAG TPA: hypothetical protein ENG40_01325 [Thermoprotei archaeon]|nr:hypothetical protein [Thermoprotei archaeon]
MNTREISFSALMSIIGNILFIPTRFTIGGQVVPDFSHIATFISAIYGGTYIGFIVGFLSGILPGVFFGPLGSLGILGLIGLPLGKSLTGLTLGFLVDILEIRKRKRFKLILPIAILSYTPECIFTIMFFKYIIPVFLKIRLEFLIPIIVGKAWIEIILISILTTILVNNRSFTEYMLKYFNR